MEFKDRMKELRKGKGITAEELATTFEKSESAVRMWETGRNKPDADTLIGLSAYFGCTVDYLLGLSEFKSSAEEDEFTQGMEDLLDYVLSLEHGKTAITELIFLMKYAVEYKDFKGTQMLENFLIHIVALGFAARAVDSARHTPFDQEALGEYIVMIGAARSRVDKAQKAAEKTTSNIFRNINAGLTALLEDNFEESTIKAILQALLIVQQDDVDMNMAKEIIQESYMMEKGKKQDEPQLPDID